MKRNTNSYLTEVLGATSRMRRPPGDLFASTGKGPRYACTWPPDGVVGGLPLVMQPSDGDTETLFADVATFYTAFSPISAYVHVVSSEGENFKGGSFVRGVSDLKNPFYALILGEALAAAYASGGEEDDVTYALCKRTLSFALARSAFLYPQLDVMEVAAKWMQLREITKADVQPNLLGAVTWMHQLLQHQKESGVSWRQTLSNDLDNLLLGRIGVDQFASELDTLYPGLSVAREGLNGPYDGRVRSLEKIGRLVAEKSRGGEMDALVMGYFFNAMLPGSFEHVRMVRRQSNRLPSILLWYAFFAGCSSEYDAIGAFSGLGLKLMRDVTRPFSLDQRPSCDVSVDELSVLSRIGLKSKMLKPFQGRFVQVSLFPGVEVSAKLFGAEETRSSTSFAELDAFVRANEERDAEARRLLQQLQVLIEAPIAQRIRRSRRVKDDD